ncbi:MAG: diguanylate cyclase domain-containing protein [Parcubacteria group bacterium Gr01-1014_8]|nr:MAG: diguanylate cyclase domain-containing protein [Parcubacteria group bacterium Gr01-1014_8]
MKKILIIDDDETFKSLMKGELDSAEYEVVCASDGSEGLQKMSESQPDGILLDIKMPGMDGLQFLKELNKKYGEGKTPVLITSNVSSMDNIAEGMALGIRGYVVKSDESAQGIIDAIDRLLK